MNIHILDQDTIIKQTVQNMLEAQVILPTEVEKFTNQLRALSPAELIEALLESFDLRASEKMRLNSYPINMRAISPN